VVDGEDTPAIFRPSNSTFFFRYTNTQGIADETLVFGASTFLPIAGEWGTVTGGGPGQPTTPPPGPGPLTVGTTLPNATLNVKYDAPIPVSGGTPPYTVQQTGPHAWATVSGGAVTGIPTTTGQTNIPVQVSDSAGAQVFAAISVNVVTQCAGLAGTTLAECLALAELYNLTNGNQWTERTNWFSTNYCTWHGITCSSGDAGRVTEIELDGNGLAGPLPTTAFTSLAQLTLFDINDNVVVGTIPLELVNLPLLSTLDLGQNGMSDDIPDQIWGKTTLLNLDLSDNGFTEDLTAAAFNLPNLVSLDLSDNQMGLTGILDNVWGLTTLTNLDLANNAFDGGIHANIQNMAVLQALDLSDNNLTGVVPDVMRTGLQDTLTSLSMHGNECFDPENAALDTFLSGFDLNWNDAGVCTP
jgi:hypothetical protein